MEREHLVKLGLLGDSERRLPPGVWRSKRIGFVGRNRDKEGTRESGRVDGVGIMGTEHVHSPGYKGQDQEGPESVLKEVEDVEEAYLRRVTQPVQRAQQPHGQQKAGYLLAISQVRPPNLGIAGRV